MEPNNNTVKKISAVLNLVFSVFITICYGIWCTTGNENYLNIITGFVVLGIISNVCLILKGDFKEKRILDLYKKGYLAMPGVINFVLPGIFGGLSFQLIISGYYKLGAACILIAIIDFATTYRTQFIIRRSRSLHGSVD